MTPHLRCCALVFLLCVPCARVSARQEQDAVPLEAGKPVARELTGGQQHRYQVALAAGQVLNVVVEQRGIDVVVVLRGADGKPILEADSPTGPQGPETVLFVAEQAGVYQLDVRSLEKDAAGRYEVRLSGLRTATAADRLRAEAFKLGLDVARLKREQRFQQAIPLAARVVAIQESLHGKEHLEMAQPLNDLAELHQDAGNYAEAEAQYLRALAIREKAQGAEHADVAEVRNNLSTLYRDRGQYAQAEAQSQIALSIREKLLGPEHMDVAQSLNNLAVYQQDKGDYAGAERSLLRCLSIMDKKLPPDHPLTANVLNNLGRLYEAMGDGVKAEPYHQRALEIRERKLGPDHLAVANSLNNLASLYMNDRGDFDRAEPLFQRALEIRRKRLGADHPLTVNVHNNLARLHRDRKEYAEAERMYESGLAMQEKRLGPNHLTLGFTINNLAWLAYFRGDYDKAEALFQRSFAIKEKSLGADHPEVADGLHDLAWLYQAKGQMPKAIEYLSRCNEIRERSIQRTLAAGSERQKLLFLRLYAGEAKTTLSWQARLAPTDPQALRLALTTLLRRKGRGLDAMTDAIASLRGRTDPQGQTMLDQLSALRAQRAALTFRGPGAAGLEPHQAQLKQLDEEVDKLEASLSSRSAEFRVQTEAVTIEAVQASLPERSALVEFGIYATFDPVAELWSPSRYLAYVLFPAGAPAWVELGEAEPIDRAVDELRKALRDPKQADVKRLARDVEERVMRPVRGLLGQRLGQRLGQTRRVLIAPEGALNLIPFAALVDERNRYLVQDYEFSYLTSGRDLLRLRTTLASNSNAVIVADPDFGDAAPAASTTGATSATSATGRLLTQQSAKPGAAPLIDLADAYFGPLPGTAGEARALQLLLRGSSALTGARATETALKQLHGPKLLHIATHGFFLADAAPPSADRSGWRSGTGGGSPVGGKLENPLLRSGLALAGANRRNSQTDDGILTALEVAGLDLWGTRMVTLSACDTGVGEVRGGEGVYGLRRALVLAGAETQVISLWPVSDNATRDLMIEYYRRLQRNEGRSEALRRVQLGMLKNGASDSGQTKRLLTQAGQRKDEAQRSNRKKDRSHPYYWASFIQSGGWTSLEAR